MSFYLKKRKKILKKLFVGLSLFFIGTLSFLFLSVLLKQFSPAHPNLHPMISVLMMTLISIAAFKPLDIAFTQLFKNYLFKNKSYAHMTLMNLAEELALVLDLNELCNLIVNTFGEVLHLKTVAILIPNRFRDDFEIASAYGWHVSDSRRVRFAKDSSLIKLIQSNGPHVLVRDRAIRMLSWQEANQLVHDFDTFHSSWVIPLYVKDEFMGAIGFAAFTPGFNVDESDFHFFREFARAVAKSLRNALSVSELKTANEELQDVQSQLLQVTKLTAIEQLATGIAHEIHNPLTIISGKAQVLLLQKDRNQIDQRVEEVLKTIVKQTKRAADITRKLLMFSQSSGSPKEVLQLEQILEDTIALVSYQTSLEGIEITRNVAGSIPPFYANVHELREVFLNLILNAVQSIGSKGTIHCEINYRLSDQIIEVSVADTGRGISSEHIDKLFNPFFTTRPDAVGLGLFVTKQIVHRYGGSIRVESRAGQGSLFIVQFPYLESTATVRAQKETSLSLFPHS
jgi:signal transduction histidine kinase